MFSLWNYSRTMSLVIICKKWSNGKLNLFRKWYKEVTFFCFLSLLRLYNIVLISYEIITNCIKWKFEKDSKITWEKTRFLVLYIYMTFAVWLQSIWYSYFISIWQRRFITVKNKRRKSEELHVWFSYWNLFYISFFFFAFTLVYYNNSYIHINYIIMCDYFCVYYIYL